MTIGPIEVPPELKHKGYGKALLDYSLEKAKEVGYGAVLFEGDNGFYGKSRDLPSRKAFADKWLSLIIKHCTDVELIILIGKYAQEYYLKDSRKLSLTRTVEAYKEYLPKYFPIVHPSPRNQIWMKKNPWYQEKVLPDLKEEVSKVLKYKEK